MDCWYSVVLGIYIVTAAALKEQAARYHSRVKTKPYLAKLTIRANSTMLLSNLLACLALPVALAAPAPIDDDTAISPRASYYYKCQVLGSAVKYRKCASTRCAAVGQYPYGKVLSIYKARLDPHP